MEIDEIKALENERNELNMLIQRGTVFEVEIVEFVRKKGFLSLMRSKTKKVTKERFTIQEPTLAVLDRISSEQIELAIDENMLSSQDGIQAARKMVKAQTKRMARIIAIAVLGQDYIISRDEKKLNILTDIFYNNIKPSRLFGLVTMISTMSNLGDFMNSIRLMSAARTTIPTRIEGKQED